MRTKRTRYQGTSSYKFKLKLYAKNKVVFSFKKERNVTMIEKTSVST